LFSTRASAVTLREPGNTLWPGPPLAGPQGFAGLGGRRPGNSAAALPAHHRPATPLARLRQPSIGLIRSYASWPPNAGRVKSLIPASPEKVE
jgi:hypothetical protein